MLILFAAADIGLSGLWDSGDSPVSTSRLAMRAGMTDAPCGPSLHEFWGSELRSSHLCHTHFYVQNHLLSPISAVIFRSRHCRDGRWLYQKRDLVCLGFLDPDPSPFGTWLTIAQADLHFVSSRGLPWIPVPPVASISQLLGL